MNNPANNVILIGNITGEPSFAKTQEGKEFLCYFSIRVKRNYKNKDGKYDGDYFQVKMTGEQKMRVAHRYKSGDSVTVSGSLCNESYTDKDGIKRYNTFVSADGISWTPGSYSKKENSQSSNSEYDSLPFN